MDPIRHELVVACTPAEAFDAWVDDIGQWWHPDYTPDPAGFLGAAIEPRVGGRVYLVDATLGEVDWGSVLAVAPGALVVHTSWLGQDPAHPSRLAVQFVPLDQGGTRVELAHEGWDESNVEFRHKFTEWPLILDRYAAFVARTR
ncbi:SRPBCC domain-containing protein [uncultured Cellulomonas sp.]|uniref:SRPBCC domain-containing protein n=1 Tax=uncultured Cellulomonas sp. TaxID=189682 RepID=UPI0028E45012|nr:SRPBCC domain-containing protein [uncultured Cellulomonas sp.]